MNNDSSSDETIAQTQKSWETFCKELPKKCEEAGFTKKQITAMKDFTKDLEPGLESVEKVTEEFMKVAEANAEAKGMSSADIQRAKKFGKFLKILEVTGELPEDMDDPKSKGIVEDKFKVWLQEGEPTPELKKEATKVEEILKIYRRKHKGEQFISYTVKGKDEQVGMKTDITYGKDGEGHEDTSIIIARTRYPTIPYTDKLAKELIAKARRHSEDGTVELHFIFRGANIHVQNEKNFLSSDFDGLVGHALNKEII